jgi:murein DD-endopeptidase MepM/ murein hydrolase activator NlpD
MVSIEDFMKTRYKVYKNQVKRSLTERYHIQKKIWGKKWEAFVKKGHEKMTIMFIPHNEKRIFNIQISKFKISFFLSLFLVIIGLSAYSAIKNAAVKSEEEKLLLNYKDVHSQLLRYEKMTNNIYDLVDDIKPEIEELYILTAGNEEIGNLWEGGEKSQEKDLTPEERRIRNMLPSEIQSLRELQRDIMNATNTVKTVKSFVDVRSKVINDTPSIIPNNGHTTSLFGWRRSPFGFGREFHTGIDIAASEGTEIHATAPGEVVSAGWGGGLGNMVRIRHKYGFETVYGHQSRIAVQIGQTIKKGQVIGYVGSTGSATGNHCHYEIRLGPVPINPYPYMSMSKAEQFR